MKNTIPETSGDVKREKAKNNAEIFVELFSPFRKKYIIKNKKPEEGLFDVSGFSPWRTADRYLTDRAIERGITGAAVIGYFLASCSRSLCVDIDDHTGKGLGYLLSVYDTIRGKLTVYPSMLCKTPRGLHAFYFLTHPVPEILLIERARRVLEGVPVEIKPTSQIGLRIPAERYLLDPRSLNRLKVDFRQAVQEAAQYHPFELFGASVLPDEIVDSLKSRKSKALRLKTWESVCGFEAEYAGGVRAGATNEALCELIPVYRSSGLTPEEAAAEFAALLAPEYAGELRNFRRLLQRVKSFYQKTPATRFNTLPKLETDLFTEFIAENISGLVRGKEETRQQKAGLTRKRRTVKKAVFIIENWKRYIDGVVHSNQFLEMWNYLYPFFKKNTKEGYYPLSSDFLKKTHRNYERFLLPFLVEVGYLERSPYQYSSIYGICSYYKINSVNFMTARPPTPAPVAKVRHSKAKLRADEIRAYKQEHPQMSNRAIGRALKVDEKTVRIALKKLDK
jgi:hypothetical protein